MCLLGVGVLCNPWAGGLQVPQFCFSPPHCDQESKLVILTLGFLCPTIGWDRLESIDNWCVPIVGLVQS